MRALSVEKADAAKLAILHVESAGVKPRQAQASENDDGLARVIVCVWRPAELGPTGAVSQKFMRDKELCNLQCICLKSGCCFFSVGAHERPSTSDIGCP
jgi:hypothetical protein